MKLSVNKSNPNSKAKTLTEIEIKEPPKKKKDLFPDIKDEQVPDSIAEQRARTMSVSKKDGILKSIKTGITTNFTAPFGLALGLSPALVTLLTSIPQLIGSFSIFLTEKLIHFVHRRKRLMVMGSFLESYTWLFVVALAALSIKNPILLILLVTLDAIFINLQYPIWNSIMSDTVPGNMRGKYFGTRNLLSGIASLSAMILGGYILDKFAGVNPLIGFAVIFAIAFISSYIATKYQSKMIDTTPVQIERRTVKYSFREFIITIKENNFGMYTWFYATFQMVVNIASPFFAIYMLTVLKFDYLTFTLITLSAAIFALASMNTWGSMIDRYGSKKIMSITAFLIPLGALLWLITTNWKMLFIVEAFSGIIWAGFNLSCSTFMFESVKSEYKVKFYTYNKVLYGVGVFLGSMLGILLYSLKPILFSSSILLIFFVSGTLRAIVAIIFIPKIQEEKVVQINFKEGKIFKNFITLRPKEAFVDVRGGIENYKSPAILTKKEQEKINSKLDWKLAQDKLKQKGKFQSSKEIKSNEKGLKESKNQKTDKSKPTKVIVDEKKSNKNESKGSVGNKQSVANNKPSVHNNPIKPARK